MSTLSCGVGACQSIVPSCVAGVPQTCTPGSPSAEICDGLDNNCNGATDDGINVGGACEGAGVCGAGVIQCFGGMGICSTEPGGTQNQSSPETCDSLDNDCDGAVDDNLGQTSCGLGQCQATTASCIGGIPQSCTPGNPSAETCDGLDNDCNGAVDNGFSVGAACDGVGQCGAGLRECNGAGGARCSTDPGGSQNQAIPERCDGLDNDCNGAIDNGFNIGAVCDGVGQCGLGVLQCTLAGDAGCSTDPGGSQGQAVTETCDGLDNDCDGINDDPFDIGQACDGVGQCGAGLRECNGSGGTRCSTDSGGSQSQAVPELCDMLDNDCDGAVDDGFEIGQACDGIGRCGAGLIECGPVQTLVCSTDPGGSQSQVTGEVCNGLDDDCDNTTDEDWNLGAACDGVGQCGMGVRECDLAGGAICSTDPEGSASQAVPEICDGLDNNCDGAIDNGIPDTDLDGTNNCLDTDDDNDGVLDPGDCAPLDDTAFAQPGPIQGLEMPLSDPTQVQWTTQSLGTGTEYDVSTGIVGPSAGSINFPSGVCLGVVPGGVGTDLRPNPAVGTIYYYIVKSRNACSAGTFGTPLRDTHPGCP